MLTILELANNFGLTYFVGSPQSLKRAITNSEIDRSGMELMGSFNYHQKDRLILLGNKEWSVIENMDPEIAYQRFKKICDSSCPGIVICQGHDCPDPLLKAATENDCPVFGTKMRTTDLLSDIVIYLSDRLALKTSLHACLLEIFSQGVLILGDSGIGKSEVSMELIKKGHQLISDDKVNISLVRDRLIGRAPDIIYGLLEVRGIGIVDVGRIFGINSLKKASRIHLAIELKPYTKNLKVDRIGMLTERIVILGQSIPKIILPVSAARSMAEIIEVAVTNFKLKETGYDSAFEFEKRLREMQERKGGK